MPRPRKGKVNTHECMIIFDANLSPEDRQAVIEKAEAALAKGEGGQVVLWDHWGERRMAYPIKNRTHGFYSVAYIQAPKASRDELERFFKFAEGVLRWLLIKPFEEPDLEAIKAKAESKARQKAQAEERAAGRATESTESGESGEQASEGESAPVGE